MKKTLKVILLFIVYVALCQISLIVQSHTYMGTQMWPAAGAAFVAMLFWGYYVWPAVFFGTLAVHLINNETIFHFLGPAIGNTIEPMIGAYLCSKDFHQSLDRFIDVVRLVAGAAFASTFLGAVIGVPWIAMLGVHDVTMDYFGQYWIGDAMGVLMVAPFFLVWTTPKQLTYSWKKISSWEMIGFIFSLALTLFLFSKLQGPARLYFFFPLILWVALRLGQRGLTSITLIISALLTWQTARGIGPFAGNVPAIANEFYLLLFLATLQMTGLGFAAATMEKDLERKSKEDFMKHSQAELEKMVIQLKEAKDAADAATAAKNNFLANVSHEVRTPLGIVLGFSEALAGNSLSPEKKAGYIDGIRRNGKQLLNLITNILDFAKLEAGKIVVNKFDVITEDLFHNIWYMMDIDASKKGIALTFNFEKNLPEKIYTDPQRLRQILVNVIGNAIKFTSHGKIIVDVTTKTDANGFVKLCMIVTDTGIGVPSDKIQTLFLPFSQIDPSITRRFGGTGLGLAHSKKLAQALGGDLELTESKPGVGSKFTLMINHLNPHQTPIKDKEAVKAPPKKLDNKRILVVDDSPDNQLLLTGFLSNTGAHVVTADNGLKAMQKTKDSDFDVILMDLQMPEMDGYEATRRLRNEGFDKPIIALTAHAMSEVKDRVLASGFDDYITKPVEPDHLIEVISEISA